MDADCAQLNKTAGGYGELESMKILVYSQVTAEHIKTSLGQPEYSYFFVLKTFLPVLRRLGDVQIIENPLQDVDRIYRECRESGKSCVFLSFTPPHKTLVSLECPVIPVFAWEYSNLPNETWEDGLFNDWVSILRRCAAALTHSSYTLHGISAALGDEFPATWAPSPVWDQFAGVRDGILQRATGSLQVDLTLDGLVLDSRTTSLAMPPPPLLHAALEKQLQVKAEEGVDAADVLTAAPKTSEAPAEISTSEPLAGQSREPNPVATAQPSSTPEPITPEPIPAGSEKAHGEHSSYNPSGSFRKVGRLLARISKAGAHAQLVEMESQVAAKDRELARKQEDIYQLSDLVHQKDADLAAKQQEIYQLSDLVSQKERELADKQNEIFALSDVVRDKEAELFEKHNEILRVARESGFAPDALTVPIPRTLARCTLTLTGVVYTTVFNPADGRKNWRDILSAFCYALGEQEDATLVLKITHHGLGVGYAEILEVLQRLAPLRCRVIALWGFLDDDSYQALIEGTAYVLNASYGEGQCMPLMEYMSCGVPAVAPNSTALQDYINENNAFVVKSSAAMTFWQHDARRALRTLHYQPHWDSLVDAIRDSYHCFRTDEPRYRQKQQMAVGQLKDYCSQDVVEQRVRKLLEQVIADQENK